MERLGKREGRVKKRTHKVCDRVRWEDRRKRRMWKEGRGKGWRVRIRDWVRGGGSTVKGSEEKRERLRQGRNVKINLSGKRSYILNVTQIR